MSPIQPQPISEALDNSVQAPAPPYENPVTATPITDWDDLQQQINACQQCQLAGTRTNIVVGRGNQKARLLLIGEAPGEQEDRHGLPFVGKAGQLLENMLAAAGIDSEREVYICNLLKCRPPGNRNPAPDEISKCSHFLQWQIDAVQPELIVAVGRFAAQSLLQEQASLSSLRGKLHQYGRYPVLVSFHPAYLLRSPGEKAKAWQDWCRVRQLLNQK
ncbi:uracil-DNA glycosylase [Vogesella oryzae]|uniref:uracil-DNA glycosylase n=1 Tax=Vogesella oryzae TaxID=1735285 RepID=UPI001FE3230B|nr:uracil-DNA glycosylase [Vogesella oryzae]